MKTITYTALIYTVIILFISCKYYGGFDIASHGDQGIRKHLLLSGDYKMSDDKIIEFCGGDSLNLSESEKLNVLVKVCDFCYCCPQEKMTIDIATFVYGGKAPYKFQWSYNDLNNSILVDVPIGQYTVTITDNNNCIETVSYNSEEFFDWVNKTKMETNGEVQILNDPLLVYDLTFGYDTSKPMELHSTRINGKKAYIDKYSGRTYIVRNHKIYNPYHCKFARARERKQSYHYIIIDQNGEKRRK